MTHKDEVPCSFELKTMLVLGTGRGWSVGSLFDIHTAFLYAELCEEEDGIIVVTPPTVLVRMGLVQEGIVWVLEEALYGLRVAPKRWSINRDGASKAAKQLRS